MSPSSNDKPGFGLRHLTVLGALGTVVTGFVLRFNHIVTDGELLWTLLLFGLACLAWFISWGLTQLYKSGVPDFKGISEDQRRLWRARIMWRCFWCCLVPSLLEGVVLLAYIGDLTQWRQVLMLGVLWLLGAVCIAGMSTFMWRVVFEAFLPWLQRRFGIGQWKHDPVTGELGYKETVDDKTRYGMPGDPTIPKGQDIH